MSGTTLLKQEEVERIRDWATAEYRKKWKAAGREWNGRVPIPQMIEQLRQVITEREKKKETGKVSKLGPDDIKKRLNSIEADLAKADKKNEGLILDDVLRYYSTDPKTRFDIQFVRERQLAAEDSLGLWVYLPFIILFSYFLVEGQGLGYGYWMNAGLLDKFLDEEFTQSDDLRYKKVYYDIASEEEFWEFVKGPLIESLWINDDDLPENQVRANQFVQHSNMPIGAIKLRQLRVSPEDCGKPWDSLKRHETQQLDRSDIVQRLNDFNVFCYPEYVMLGTEQSGGMERERGGASYEAVDEVLEGNRLYSESDRCAKDPNCDLNAFPVTYVRRTKLNVTEVADQFVSEAFQWRSCSELNASDASRYYGKAGSYGCDGFAQIIPFDWTLEKVMNAVDRLENGISVEHFNPFSQAQETSQVKWIDKQTRGLAIEMFLYNQNIELTTHFVFFVELTAAGAWIPLHSTISFKIFDFDEHDGAWWFFYFLYFFWVVGYVLVWVRNIVHQTQVTRSQMLQSNNDTCGLWFSAFFASVMEFWIWFDFVNLSLFIVAWGIRFNNMHLGLTTNNLLQNLYYPPQYEDVAYLGQIGTNINAVNAMLVYLRIFYFLKLNPRLNLLTKTIGEARDEIVAILVIFAFVFIAFALMCYVVYGHVDEGYRTFGETAISLMLMLLGDFDYIALRESHRVFTPIFFALFQILAVFLLFNMVIAVLGDAFTTVQENKFKDRTLVRELVAFQNDRWKPGAGPNGESWKVPTLVLRNSLVTEMIYWFKHCVLFFKRRLCGMSDEAYEEEREVIRSQNPRIYWARLEKSFYDNKKSTNFVDHLQLTPKMLDDYLDEMLGNDKEYFLHDKDSGEEGIILKYAKKTRVAPEVMVEDMMEYHHEWFKEMSQKTQTGNEEDLLAQRKQRMQERQPTKKDEIDELFAAKFAGNPQRRWEEQRAKLEQLRAQLVKMVPDQADGPKDKCVPCGTKKTEVVDTLESKITSEIEHHIDSLICTKINEIMEKILTQDMPSWITELVETATESTPGAHTTGRSSFLVPVAPPQVQLD